MILKYYYISDSDFLQDWETISGLNTDFFSIDGDIKNILEDQ